MSWKDNIRFILVEPKEPGNAGSTARAIKNMGFRKLALVKPFRNITTRKEYLRYIKDTDFLIAQPEKALLDMFYLCLKGLRKLPTEELDLSRINIRTFRLYAEKIAVPQFQTFIRKHKMV